MQNRFDKLRYAPFLLMLVVAVAAVFWWGRSRRFPYQGVWQDSYTIVKFTPDGGCDIVGPTGKNKGKRSCLYYMRGSDAIVDVRIFDFGSGQGPTDWTNTWLVTPDDGGQVLHIKTIGAVMQDPKTRKQLFQRWDEKQSGARAVYKVSG